LYHLVLLLPTRKNLGERLKPIFVSDYLLTGNRNHGYSEAFYLDGPKKLEGKQYVYQLDKTPHVLSLKSTNGSGVKTVQE